MEFQHMLDNFKAKLKPYIWKYIMLYRRFTYKNRLVAKEETNIVISEAIKNGEPFMVTRLGSVELRAIKEVNTSHKISSKTKYSMNNNAGFFPANEKNIEDFAKIYEDSLAKADLIGCWFNPYEDRFINKCNEKIISSYLLDLEPYYHKNPWSQYLAGKKILVIHPFVDSINKQYIKREKLFSWKVLPEFEEIKFIKAVQSNGGNDEFESWFEALEYMKNQIDNNIDFDIAIIGCGAYGMPLAAYCKEKGKQAIHLGGATQLLFGIKGKRWDNYDFIPSLYNDEWIYPSEDEKPKNFLKIEDGCYW